MKMKFEEDAKAMEERLQKNIRGSQDGVREKDAKNKEFEN